MDINVLSELLDKVDQQEHYPDKVRVLVTGISDVIKTTEKRSEVLEFATHLASNVEAVAESLVVHRVIDGKVLDHTPPGGPPR